MNSGWGPGTLACLASDPNGGTAGCEWRTRSQGDSAQANLNAHAMMSWQCFLDIKSKSPGMDWGVRGAKTWRINTHGWLHRKRDLRPSLDPAMFIRRSESGVIDEIGASSEANCPGGDG